MNILRPSYPSILLWFLLGGAVLFNKGYSDLKYEKTISKSDNFLKMVEEALFGSLSQEVWVRDYLEFVKLAKGILGGSKMYSSRICLFIYYVNVEGMKWHDLSK